MALATGASSYERRAGLDRPGASAHPLTGMRQKALAREQSVDKSVDKNQKLLAGYDLRPMKHLRGTRVHG